MDSRKSTFETLRGYSSRSRENFLPFFQVQDDKISSRKYASRQRINTAKEERGHDGLVAVIEQEEEEKIDHRSCRFRRGRQPITFPDINDSFRAIQPRNRG